MVLVGRSHGTSENKYFSTKLIKNINAENNYLTQLNNEDDIKNNRGNYGRHFPIPQKNISGLTGYELNKLDPEEINSNSRNIN